MALAQAGDSAGGAVAYVSLEPCAHQGQTPPCADALMAAGVARVVTAATDPDNRVCGRGHDRLRGAGIAVHEGVLGAAAVAANAGFIKRVQQGIPYLTLKLAMSLDGRIANAAGASRWITGPVARRHVHALRARHDAVMIGIGTALADDPDLTVRDLGVAFQPVRIVLDSALRLPVDGRLARSARDVPVWVLHCTDQSRKSDALSRAGVTLIRCAAGDGGRLDICDAMRQLGAAGLTRVMCEGGAGVGAALLKARQVDALVGYSAGRVFGAGGTPAIGTLPGDATLSALAEFDLVEMTQVGEDIVHHWRRR
jgi:diaminohydroxyphosphoribosylaminopyrimidine deaminase/5-amino-6-(5-phosphoribosylamino)uracil reductase